MQKTATALAVALLFSAGTAVAQAPKGDLMYAEGQLKKFAPVKIEVEGKLLNKKQRKFVDELVKAARVMDELFLRQSWDGNVKLREELGRAGKPAAPLAEYFGIMFGPYDRLEHNRPFIDGVGPKPAGAAFYPVDMTKEEFAAWIKKNPADKDAFESTFTVIRRNQGKLVAVPYSKEYEEMLKKAADHLRRAAELTENESLKKYLTSRADAFISNDYYQSDVDWVHLKDHDIEVVIGPYEVYEDELLGYKGAFEAFITRVDPDESARLQRIGSSMAELERHLPISDEYKGVGRSLESPIVVVQLIFSAGDSKAGVQTLAFNLPNDEKVRNEEGSKKVLLKNVQHAKFSKILLPIAREVMRAEDVSGVGFDAFFAHTLVHEISHGIGPGEIVKNGKKTNVNRELKDLYSVLEECKADTLGVYNLAYLIEKGFYPKELGKTLWPTYLAGMFRSVRFGINAAHGGGNAIQFNYILDKGGFRHDPATGRFSVDEARVHDAARDLARDVLMIQAKGDYRAAKAFVEKYRAIRPEMAEALGRLSGVPVDIKPIYTYRDEG